MRMLAIAFLRLQYPGDCPFLTLVHGGAGEGKFQLLVLWVGLHM